MLHWECLVSLVIDFSIYFFCCNKRFITFSLSLFPLGFLPGLLPGGVRPPPIGAGPPPPHALHGLSAAAAGAAGGGGAAALHAQQMASFSAALHQHAAAAAAAAAVPAHWAQNANQNGEFGVENLVEASNLVQS